MYTYPSLSSLMSIADWLMMRAGWTMATGEEEGDEDNEGDVDALVEARWATNPSAIAWQLRAAVGLENGSTMAEVRFTSSRAAHPSSARVPEQFGTAPH